MRNRYQTGFSLVEVAIVLVVIGLLLGALLKGQELINSARARTFADLATDTQAAYYGFVDRYNRVPGDWNATAAAEAIGDATIAHGGDDSGSIENPCASCGTAWQEPNAMWEQMSKSGFVQGAYDGTDEPPSVNNNLTPVNPFSRNIVLGRTSDFLGAAAGDRLNLSLGRGIPVDIAQELDIKLDDGVPDSGVVRLATDGATGVFTPVTDSSANCHNDPGTGEVYNVGQDEQDCSLVYLF